MDKYIKLFWEFFRYSIVGGIAFLADFSTLFLFRDIIFSNDTEIELFISAAVGFVVGLAVNYILSVLFVFKAADNKNSGRDVKSFVIFAVVGIIGLGLTELGMYIGVYVFEWHYLVTKIIVAVLVLVWNYCGRKIFVFGKGEKKA